MRWEKMQSEREVWGGKDGQRLDEDVGDGFVFGEMGVELVSKLLFGHVSKSFSTRHVRSFGKVVVFQIELIIGLQRLEGFILHARSGNRKR
jgi:hypothetical protein